MLAINVQIPNLMVALNSAFSIAEFLKGSCDPADPAPLSLISHPLAILLRSTICETTKCLTLPDPNMCMGPKIKKIGP